MMRGAAAPEGPMTYDSTQDNFLWFPFFAWGLRGMILGLTRPVMESERPDLGLQKPNLGSMRLDLGSGS